MEVTSAVQKPCQIITACPAYDTYVYHDRYVDLIIQVPRKIIGMDM